MSVIYFDRNVFDHICTLNCGVTESDVAKIQRAVDSGIITIPASYTVIEETVPLIRVSEEVYDQHIQTVLRLVDKNIIIKPHNHLVKEDCLSYAFKERQTSRTTQIPEAFSDVLNLSLNRVGLNALADEIHAFYGTVAAGMQADFDSSIQATKQRGYKGFDSFQQVWDALALTFVERAVNQLPRIPKRLCKKHGLGNMLNIKSVRIYTIYYCWLFYSHWLKTDGVPAKVKASEGGDFFHAVCASAADIFVTQESKDKYGRLPFILNQLAIPSFSVMSLSEFLESLS
jgi:hypothetical protein